MQNQIKLTLYVLATVFNPILPCEDEFAPSWFFFYSL